MTDHQSHIAFITLYPYPGTGRNKYLPWAAIAGIVVGLALVWLG